MTDVTVSHDVVKRAIELVHSIVEDQFGVRDETNLTDAWYSVSEKNAQEIIDFARDLSSLTRTGEATFQGRVHPWMMACFGEEISNDRLERGDRMLEEVLEALQSGDYPEERVAALTKYTYGRPKGEPFQEIGGVMVTVAAYCLAHGIDMHAAAEAELARIWTKVEKIRAKQALKPVGSALPIAHPATPAIDDAAVERDEWQLIDTAPKDGTVILGGHDKFVFTVWWDQDADGWVDGNTSGYSEELTTYEVTYWRSLPAPPAALLAAHGRREE